MTLRVATWNIREASAAASNEPFDPWEFVQELNLDILALQEVPFDDGRSSKVLSAMRSLVGLRSASALPLHPSGFGASMSGLATLSRHPQSEPSNRFFDPEGQAIVVDGRLENVHHKALSQVTCLTQLGSVVLFNLHLFPFQRMGLPASHERFESVWRIVRGQLDASRDLPTVVLGDFNTPIRELAMAPDAGYSRVVGDRVTHEGFASDDILISRHFQTRRVELLENPSDHLLCFAELEMAERPGG
ncbi:endonuclease/exonuclease/phosphatase family protein [Micromonospora tarensis]|uniref:Endonuclease/exonuclease/phosphatase family protein n=1 Tax=Micromonospora tarensis TaxID=2806100 RepID=A0ABS1YLX8_9ACTN|nr:endonuclease/exonuclease/phosphatase family protein [Micromonospora tarensis]MBM0278433.1 endonuclease/exonuclease/phosphatase family protein [Micromonospora tarensis]